MFNRLARSGVPRRPPVPRRRPRPGKDELSGLYEDQGLSLCAIASRYGVSAQAVHGWLVAAGIPRRAAGGSTAPLDDGVLAARYRQGRTGEELAREFGCSSATVYRRLEAAGVARRTPTVAIDRDTLLDGLAAGSSAPTIAAAAGVSVTAVCRALTREHLHTASQLAKLDTARYHRTLLARAEQVGTGPPSSP